jgi:hypothetical protein
MTPAIGKLLVLWLMFARKGSAAALPEPGQGGVKKQMDLRGLDGRAWHVTIFNDTTRLATTDKVSFYANEDGKVIRVLKGSQAEMTDALANLPE